MTESPTLAELTQAASDAREPSLVAPLLTRFGRIDPLGIRQINFDLMDAVFPGLNNVARHVRPFVVIAWAWRRASQLAAAGGDPYVRRGALIDFVDRIEVLYVTTQLLRDRHTDLPGSEALGSLLDEDALTFGGPGWEQLRKKRRQTTALSAAANYGPGLKQLGWLVPHPDDAQLMVPTEAIGPALDAFESKIEHMLDDAAFSSLGPVVVPRDSAVTWAESWRLDAPTRAEARVMGELLRGIQAPPERRLAFDLMLRAMKHVGPSEDPEVIRAAMAGSDGDFVPPARLLGVRDAWRRLQVRQLFRLALESLFQWVLGRLTDGARSLDELVRDLLAESGAEPGSSARSWLAPFVRDVAGPSELIERIKRALEEPRRTGLVAAILAGLGFCLTQGAADEHGAGRRDRLPLSRACAEAEARYDSSSAAFARHVIESWVLGQHAYSSVGRGLSDARARRRVLLRLRVFLEEGGWTLAPGVSLGNPPRPTGDRLRTALSLARECRLA